MKFQILEALWYDFNTGMVNISPDCEKKLIDYGLNLIKEESHNYEGKIFYKYFVEINTLEKMVEFINKLKAELQCNNHIYVPSHLCNIHLYKNEFKDMDEKYIKENWNDVFYKLLNRKALYTQDDLRHPYFGIDIYDNAGNFLKEEIKKHIIVCDGWNVYSSVENEKDGKISSLMAVCRDNNRYLLSDIDFNNNVNFKNELTFDSKESFEKYAKDFLIWLDDTIADIEEE